MSGQSLRHGRAPQLVPDPVNENALILAIGDVHLGTSCSGLPDGLSDLDVDPASLAPAAALRLAVDCAIDRKVDCVLFAGDVVESANARFEAMAPLEKNVQRLVDAGIEVIAVAGNHDVDALPRLAQLIGGFRLLGAGGRWEAALLSRAGEPFAQVLGWSFPRKHVRESPLAQLLAEPLPTPSSPVPRIGLLHGDLGASGGRYAPIRQSELDDAGCDAWLLGHIHKPSLAGASAAPGARPCGYLGSLVGLDPSETGPRGPWLVKLSADGGVEPEHIALAPLRWERIQVPVDGIGHADDLADRLLAEARERAWTLAEDGLAPRALGLRAELVGASSAYDNIRKWIADGAWKSMLRSAGDTVVFFNRITDAMDLSLDLRQLASGHDPAALLAQRLLLLGQDDERSRDFLGRGRAHLSEIDREDIWQPVREHRSGADSLSDEDLRAFLLRSGKAALSAMLSSQKSS